MTVRCPNCNAPNRDTARFCASCGAPVPALTQSPGPPTAPGVTGMLPARYLLRNRYIILEKIGQGGMGAVYKAGDTHIPGKLWAVKELSDAAITDPLDRRQASQDFHREAQLLARLDHPNIPKVIDSFTEGGRKYLVMEYIDGETLAQRLERLGGGPLPPDMVARWAIQLCDALDYMHRQNPPIIFRDLKPGNVMITRTGQVKLIDFGIARLFKPGKKQDTQFFGTAGYSPREQYGYGQTDARSDVYALGATLHHLLTGIDPTDNPLHFEPIRDLNPAVPPHVADAVMKAVSLSPQDRWESMAQMRAALSRGQAGPYPPTGQVMPPPLTAPPKPRRPTTRLIMAAADLSNTQLAIAIGALLVFTILGVWLGTPLMRRVPVLWNNLPLIALVGPLTYTATRRHWLTLVTFTLVGFFGGVVLWQQVAYESENYLLLLLGALLTGLFMEGWVRLLPRVKRGGGEETWLVEMLWLALMASIGVTIFYVVPAMPTGSIPLLQVGTWIGAAVLGSVGWFLGDMVDQYLFLRRTGVRRRRR